MPMLQITYDLHKPGQDYDELYKAIRSLGHFIHPVESVWFVVPSDENAGCKEIRDALLEHVDDNDVVIVTRVDAAAWRGLSDKRRDWLKANL